MGVARAKADLERCQKEIGRLESQLYIAKSRQTKLENYIELASEYEPESDSESTSQKFDRLRRTPIVDAAVSLLAESRTSLHTRDLLERLEAQGILVPGQNPMANLSSMLSRSDELVSDRTHGWSLASDAKNTIANHDTQSVPPSNIETSPADMVAPRAFRERMYESAEKKSY